MDARQVLWFDDFIPVGENRRVRPWACGAAGSALPWHGRGRRFDPDQVHHLFNNLRLFLLPVCRISARIHPPAQLEPSIGADGRCEFDGKFRRAFGAGMRTARAFGFVDGGRSPCFDPKTWRRFVTARGLRGGSHEFKWAEFVKHNIYTLHKLDRPDRSRILYNSRPASSKRFSYSCPKSFSEPCHSGTTVIILATRSWIFPAPSENSSSCSFSITLNRTATTGIE